MPVAPSRVPSPRSSPSLGLGVCPGCRATSLLGKARDRKALTLFPCLKRTSRASRSNTSGQPPSSACCRNPRIRAARWPAVPPQQKRSWPEARTFMSAVCPCMAVTMWGWSAASAPPRLAVAGKATLDKSDCIQGGHQSCPLSGASHASAH